MYFNIFHQCEYIFNKAKLILNLYSLLLTLEITLNKLFFITCFFDSNVLNVVDKSCILIKKKIFIVKGGDENSFQYVVDDVLITKASRIVTHRVKTTIVSRFYLILF